MLQKYKTYKRNIHILVEGVAGFGLTVTYRFHCSASPAGLSCAGSAEIQDGGRTGNASLSLAEQPTDAETVMSASSSTPVFTTTPRIKLLRCSDRVLSVKDGPPKKPPAKVSTKTQTRGWLKCRLKLFLQSNNTWGEPLFNHFAFWERVGQSHQRSSSVRWCPPGFQHTAQ